MFKESEILGDKGDALNGCMVIKIDQEQVKEDLGISRDSPLYIPQERAFAGASSRGRVVKLAEDAFGEKYQEKYGKVKNPPRIGDYVLFTPYQSCKIDKEGLYYLVTDDSLKFVVRQ